MANGISTLGQSLAQIERLKTLQSQLSGLTMQLTTGKNAWAHKDLGSNLMATQRSRASLKDIEAFTANIETADRRLKMMSNSVAEMKRQAGLALDVLMAQSQESDFDIDAVSDLASKIRDFVTNLVNERDGDRYIFGGTDPLTKPLTDNGMMDNYLQTQIEQWTDGLISSQGLIDSYRDTDLLDGNTIGYSAEMASGSVRTISSRVDNIKEIEYGALANDQGIRDILAVTGLMENLTKVMDSVQTDPDGPPGQVTAPGTTPLEQNDNFFALYEDMVKMLNSGMDRLETLEFNISQAQVELKTARDQHALEKNVLSERIGNIENVDLNEVAMKLNSLQIQIEASYRVTASIKDLNLTNFLPI